MSEPSARLSKAALDLLPSTVAALATLEIGGFDAYAEAPLTSIARTPSSKVITRLLADWSRGDRAAFDQLVPLLYGDLRRLAARQLRQESPDHTLQPTALVHEAYLKLIDQRRVDWKNRAHFFAIAARLMRRILVDHARSRQATKRGEGARPLSLDHAVDVGTQRVVPLVALDDALSQLQIIDPMQSRIVELRYFGGLTLEETAAVVGVSERTVGREWNVAKAWLFRELATSSSDGG